MPKSVEELIIETMASQQKNGGKVPEALDRVLHYHCIPYNDPRRRKVLSALGKAPKHKKVSRPVAKPPSHPGFSDWYREH